MTFANVSEIELIRDLAKSGNYRDSLDDLSGERCFPDGRLAELARRHLSQFSVEDREHCTSCSRCARAYVLLRSAAVVATLPETWHVVLSADADTCHIEPLRVQFVGRISLETYRFSVSTDDHEWEPHPLSMRVSIVLDLALSLVSVRILDVPDRIERGAFQGPDGWTRFARRIDESLLEKDLFFDRETAPNSSFRSVEEFIEFVRSGRMRFRFDCSAPRFGLIEVEHFTDMLFRLGAVEHDSPYWLPNGLRTDTYVNVATLCRHEFAIDRVAAELDALFANETFECILSHGWALGTIAQRLAKMRSRHGRLPEDIVCIGYSPPILMSDIPPRSRVLVLVDVVVTGTLVAEISSLVTGGGATLAGVGAVACSNAYRRADEQDVRSLCRIEMTLEPGAATHRSEVPSKDWVFNPFSCTMTKRSRESRSPSEFLKENSEASEFWHLVDRVDAYQAHKKERQAHYLAFVDTLKLLRNNEVGAELLAKFARRICKNFVIPDVVVVPGKRQRGKLLGKRLAKCLAGWLGRKPALVVATWGKHGWKVPAADLGRLANARVLVVDTAIGRGRTIDSLCRLVNSVRPANVGAAVLISRMPEASEEALDYRIPDGLVSLYHLPIQPVVIRGRRNDLCPICAEKEAVRAAMQDESGRNLFNEFEKWLSRPGMSRRTPPVTTGAYSERAQQLALFPTSTDEFFMECRPKIAGAVTLHSLGAATMNGMASLALPELSDSGLRPAVKSAMVEHLPPRVLEWSGEGLERELEQVLATCDKSGLWRATARVLCRENYEQWFEYLGEALQRFQSAGKETSGVFWGSMIWNAHVNSRADTGAANRLANTLRQLLDDCNDQSARAGVEKMLIAACRDQPRGDRSGDAGTAV